MSFTDNNQFVLFGAPTQRVNQRNTLPSAIKVRNLDARNISNDTFIDKYGVVSTVSFITDSYQASTQVQISNTFAYTDISGSSLSFTLQRTANILITFFANIKLYATDPFRGYHIDVAVAIDGTTQQNDAARFEVSNMNSDLGTCLSFAKTYTLAAGDHTILLRWAGFSDSTSELNSRGLTYCLLGY